MSVNSWHKFHTNTYMDTHFTLNIFQNLEVYRHDRDIKWYDRNSGLKS